MFDTLCDVVIIAETQRGVVGGASGPGVKLNPAFLRRHRSTPSARQLNSGNSQDAGTSIRLRPSMLPGKGVFTKHQQTPPT
ncbi:MAG: hypothetical protein JSS02_22365 [Planctomycetes bacterium]|nr:hypothetical protein [Planctomycetota bacterium]